MTVRIALCLASVAVVALARPSHAQLLDPIDDETRSPVVLRSVDRATVRVIAVGGADATAIDSDQTSVRRVVAVPRAGHGSGVVIGADGLVLTARHVIAGSDAIAVILPGASIPRAARVVYIDPDRDIAFLAIDGEVADHLELPASPVTIQVAQPVSASGYPVDVRERQPAAVSGTVSRENNDGSLQLAMSVNEGNSGGPVVTEDGTLLGILVKRGDVSAGIAGVAIVEPVRFIVAAHQLASSQVAGARPGFDAADRAMAQIVADFVRTDDGKPVYEATSLDALRQAAAAKKTPALAMITAAHAWNMHIALLEARMRRERKHLPTQDQKRADELVKIALALSRSTAAKVPYIHLIYPIARSIVSSRGQSFVPAESEKATSSPPPTTAVVQAESSSQRVRFGQRFSFTTGLAFPTGDFGQELGASMMGTLKVAGGQDFGKVALSLGGYASAVKWAGDLEGDFGLLSAGGFASLAVRIQRIVPSVSIGLGLDQSLVDSNFPSDTGGHGIGLDIEVALAYALTKHWLVTGAFTIHPGYAKFFENFGDEPDGPTVSFTGLSVGFSRL